MELLERRLVLDTRSITGFGNNIAHPTWGEAGTDLIRKSPVAYADGLNSPSLPDNLSARSISNILNDQTDPQNPLLDLNTVNSKSLSDFAYVWGQFIDHDMDLTPDGGAAFNIPVDPGDPIGPDPLPFTRSQFDPATGTTNPRQQINVLTSFLDLSQVYGSDNEKADALRTHVGGSLKMSPGNMLPYNNPTYFDTPIDMANDAMQVPNDQLFVTGDRRGNENIELTALQTLFAREHNRLANLFHAQNPSWSDERLYQEARKINIAEEEIITYTEFLPAILGPNALPAYRGYNQTVNPTIATEFSTSLFRFGHSLLSGTVGRQTNDGLDIPDVSPDGAGVDLAQDFFDPYLVNPAGDTDPLTGHTSSDIGAILKADADNTANEMDVLAIRQIRNLLFGPEGSGGQDLIARDIQRGRDHGLPDYNTMREAYGLPRVTTFADITRNVTVQQELQQAYGSVDNIDSFEGALAEDHVRGANVGPLIKVALVDQFARLRDGDRFFYLNEQFNPFERSLLQGTTLTRVIERNTPITNLQSNVFFFKASISGTVFFDFDGDGGTRQYNEPGLSDITVQLNDDSGTVLATAVTDNFGHYRFNEQTGLPGTGQFTVSIVVPPGMSQTTKDPDEILVSRGDINRRGIDFGITNIGNGPATGGNGSSVVSLGTSLQAMQHGSQANPLPSNQSPGTIQSDNPGLAIPDVGSTPASSAAPKSDPEFSLLSETAADPAASIDRMTLDDQAQADIFARDALFAQ